MPVGDVVEIQRRPGPHGGPIVDNNADTRAQLDAALPDVGNGCDSAARGRPFPVLSDDGEPARQALNERDVDQ